MGSVLLVIHLITAIFLVALILMQRSSGGALNGLGGGSGANNFLNVRGTGNLLTKATAILALVFFCTSIALSIYYKGLGHKAASSIVDSVPVENTLPAEPSVPVVPLAK